MKYLCCFAVLFVIGCSSKHDIEHLESEKVKFENLPNVVVQYIKNPTDVQNDIESMLLILPKGEKEKYKLETVRTWIGPWVSYEKLINLTTGASYNIRQGYPSPYIVFEDVLYIPDEFNMFTVVDDLDALEFTKYSLDQ